MAGVKGRSGRRKLPSNIIKETLERAGDDFPRVWQKNLELALAGDRDALKIYFSYVLGNPKSQVDLRVKSLVVLTADDYELSLRAIKAHEQQLLNAGTTDDKDNTDETT